MRKYAIRKPYDSLLEQPNVDKGTLNSKLVHFLKELEAL